MFIDPRFVAGAAAKIATSIAKELVRDPAVPVQRENIPAIAEAIAPTIQHLTNNEKWYQSRVTLGAILSMVSGILAIFGYAMDVQIQGAVIEMILAVGTVVSIIAGPLLTLWGRWKATKPLGV